MKSKSILAFLPVLTLFIIGAFPTVCAEIGSGPFYMKVTTGNWNLLIIAIQFTLDGTSIGPLYDIMEQVSNGTVMDIGPFPLDETPDGLEIFYYFDGETYVYIILSDWAEKGLEIGKTYTMIMAIGVPLTYPLIEEPVEGDTTIMVSSPILVGGIYVPNDKFALLAPYIGLASTILLATAATAIYVKRRKKKKQ